MATPRRAACAEVTALERSDKVARVRKCSNLRTLLSDAFTRPVPRAARKLQMLRTRDVAQDSIGYRGYHRVSSVLGGRTAEIAIFGKNIAIFGKKITFFGKILPFCQHILPFLAICTEKFWISQGIEDIRGFQRVSQGFERRVGLPPFVGGLRLRGFASLESRVCRLEHLRSDGYNSCLVRTGLAML